MFQDKYDIYQRRRDDKYMKDKFKNYNYLKSYLKVVAKNNNHDINFDDFNGLEKIFDYLQNYKNNIKYNFTFSEWIKLVQQNDTSELKHVSDIGKCICENHVFDESLIKSIGLKICVRTNIDKDMICTYIKPKMSTNIGCYFIYDNNDELVYIGKSTSDLLSRSCASATERVLGDFRRIELLEFNTKAETSIFEIYYITKYKPKFNSESKSKDNLPFDLPDTSISRETIMCVDKQIFNDRNSKDYLDYKQSSIANGFIVFEKSKGYAFRPIIPLR